MKFILPLLLICFVSFSSLFAAQPVNMTASFSGAVLATNHIRLSAITSSADYRVITYTYAVSNNSPDGFSIAIHSLAETFNASITIETTPSLDGAWGAAVAPLSTTQNHHSFSINNVSHATYNAQLTVTFSANDPLDSTLINHLVAASVMDV